MFESLPAVGFTLTQTKSIKIGVSAPVFYKGKFQRFRKRCNIDSFAFNLRIKERGEVLNNDHSGTS